MLPSRRLLVLVITLAAMSARPARAQSWTGPAGAVWSNSQSWKDALPPSKDGTGAIVFQASANSPAAYGSSVLDADWNVRNLTFNSLFVIYGGAGGHLYASASEPALTLQGGFNNASGFPQIIDPRLILGAPNAWADTGGGVTITRPVSGSGGIQKTGPGTIDLPANSTFSGGVSILGGTLRAADDTALGDAAGAVMLDGGTLFYNSAAASLTSARLFQVGTGGGVIRIGDPPINFGNAHTLSLNGSLAGPGSLALDTANSTFRNVGRVALAGVNTFAGDLTVGNVTVLPQGLGQRLGAGNVTLQAYGVLKLNAAANLAPGRTVALSPSSVLVLNDGNLQPAAVVDPTRTTGGILALGAAERAAPLNLAAIGNGQLSLGAAASVVYSAPSLGAGAGGVYRLGGGARPIPSAAMSLTIAGHDNVLTGTNSAVIGLTNPGGSPSPNADVDFTGSVVLGNRNDFSGGVTLISGSLTVGAEGALGSGALTSPASTGNSYLSVISASRTLSNPLVFTGASNGIGGLVIRGADSVTLAGPIDLSGQRGQLTSQLGSGVLTLAGGAANGTLGLAGGNIVLAASNAASLVIGGRVQFSEDAYLGPAGAAVTLEGGSLISTAPDVTVARPIVVSNSYSGITNDGTLTLTGAITGNSNANFSKNGGGALVLTNEGSTMPITVNAGTLRLSNPKGGTRITLGNATLTGTGFAGYTSAGAGSHIAPGGVTAPGTLTIGSGLSLSDGASLDYRLGTGAADRLVLDGHFLQGGGGVIAVNLADAGGLAPGQSYTLLDWGTADSFGISAASFQLGSGPVGGTLSIVGSTLRLATAALTPFQQWQRQFFGTSAHPNAALTASPAKDGISNLVKYALGLDPLHSAVASLPVVTANAGVLTLTYGRSLAATDIVYQPLASDDLQTWSADGITQSADAPNGAIQTVHATAPAGRRFMKLVVTRLQ